MALGALETLRSTLAEAGALASSVEVAVTKRGEPFYGDDIR
jgi:hypothetical protein